MNHQDNEDSMDSFKKMTEGEEMFLIHVIRENTGIYLNIKGAQ